MRLEKYLSEKSLTPTEFARKIRVQPMSVGRYCRNRIPKPEVMARIVAATNGAVTPSDFYPSKQTKRVG